MKKSVVDDSISHRKRDKSLTLQELEIMSIFTSEKWSDKSYLGSYNVVDAVEEKEMESNEKLISVQSYGAEKTNKSNFNPKNTGQEKYSISEHKNTSEKSDNSSQLLLRKKKKIPNSSHSSRNKFNNFSESHSSTNNMSKNVSSKTLKTMKIAEKSGSKLTSNKDSSIEDFVSEDEKPPKNMMDEDLSDTVRLTNSNAVKSDKIFFEEQEISLKRESSFISLLSSYGSCFRKTLINNDLDDINDSCTSEITDVLSTWSLNTSNITRDVMNQAQSCDLVTKKHCEELANDKAVEIIMKKTKMELGKFLIEGSYEVSRCYHHDPFTSLGKWLLIQADIRDEYNTEQELCDSKVELSMT